jgi:hypothetical protein
MLYDEIDPIGGRRLDLLVSNLCDVIAKVNGVKNTNLDHWRLQYGVKKAKKRLSNSSILKRTAMLIKGLKGKISG